MKATQSEGYTLTPLSGSEYSSCVCGSERKTLSWTMLPSVIGRHLCVVVIVEFIIRRVKMLRLSTFAGVVSVTVSAEAVASHASCDNEIVSVPERGRIDTVTRSLIVKVKTRRPKAGMMRCHGDVDRRVCVLFQAEGTEMTKIHNWLLCPKGQSSLGPDGASCLPPAGGLWCRISPSSCRLLRRSN